MPISELPPSIPAELAEHAFVLGRWDGGETVEQWTAVADGYWGIGFSPGKDGTSSFEVMRIDVAEGGVQFVGRPGGKAATAFPKTASDAASVTFLNPTHDDPQRVRYALKGKKLVAAIGPTEGPDHMTWKYKPAEVERVDALEQADIAFAADVASRGVEAWVSVFDANGFQWDDQENVAIRPGDTMREYMSRLLAGKLEWVPVSSGMSPAGDLGFTVGTWTWTGDEGRAARGSYVTVWRRQADGTWKIWFDGGDPA